MKHEFSWHISEKSQISNFMKIRPVGAQFFHVEKRAGGRTDRQTDMMKLTVDFRTFMKVPKIQSPNNV